jgi:hypothetical protein
MYLVGIPGYPGTYTFEINSKIQIVQSKEGMHMHTYQYIIACRVVLVGSLLANREKWGGFCGKFRMKNYPGLTYRVCGQVPIHRYLTVPGNRGMHTSTRVGTYAGTKAAPDPSHNPTIVLLL